MNSINRATKPAHVITANKRQACIELAKMAVSDDTKVEKAEASALSSAFHLGAALLDHKRDIPHGHWLKELEAIGISNEFASECMRFALIAPHKLKELGSKRAARRYLRENEESNSGRPEFGEDQDDREDDVQQADEQPAADKPASAKIAADKPTASKKPKQAKGGYQQTFPFEGETPPDKTQERLEARVRNSLREVAGDIGKVRTRLQQALRCGARTVDRLRQLAREAGFEIRKVTVEKAAGFEDNGDHPTEYEDFPELTSIEQLLLQAAGNDENPEAEKRRAG